MSRSTSFGRACGLFSARSSSVIRPFPWADAGRAWRPLADRVLVVLFGRQARVRERRQEGIPMQPKTDPELAELRQRVRLLDVERTWRVERVTRAEDAVDRLQRRAEAFEAEGNLAGEIMRDRLRDARRQLTEEREALVEHDAATLRAQTALTDYLGARQEEAC